MFVNVTPRRAPASLQNHSSSVRSPNLISVGLASGSPLMVPVPCTHTSPQAPSSWIVQVAPGSMVSSFAENRWAPAG